MSPGSNSSVRRDLSDNTYVNAEWGLIQKLVDLESRSNHIYM